MAAVKVPNKGKTIRQISSNFDFDNELRKEKPSYKALFMYTLEELRSANEKVYNSHYVLEAVSRNPECVHIWEWELVSESGIVFCVWKCKCGVEVSQLIGERCCPEKIPIEIDLAKKGWSE